MSVSIVSVLSRSIFLVALLGAITFVTANAEAKGSKVGGAKPALAHASLPSHMAKPSLKPMSGQIAKSPSLGGPAARTKAPTGNPLKVPTNPILNPNLKPVKQPLVGTPINPGAFPTFPPINPGTGGGGGGGFPTTPPYTPPINPNPAPGCHPNHPCYPRFWFGVGFGYRYGLYGWRNGCYIPPVCTVPVVQTVNAGGDTIIVQDNDTILAGAQPIEAAAELPRVVVASTVSLSGSSLGADAGQVLLEINGLALPCRVDVWAADKATATLPSFGLGSETKGKMHVIRADGSVARSLDCVVVPAVEAAK